MSRWIGGIYEGRAWRWGSSGQAVAYKAFPRRTVSRDWSWHCISLDASAGYQWRPASCLHPQHYICERPLRRSRGRAPPAPAQGQGAEQPAVSWRAYVIGPTHF